MSYRRWRYISANLTKTAIIAYQPKPNQNLTKTAIIAFAYSYDGLGRREYKNAWDVVKTEFLYDGNQAIAEYSSTGAMTKRFIYAPGVDRPVAMQTEGKLYYYHSDELGSVVALSDDGGALVEQYSYGPFGQSDDISNLGNPLRYTARRLDNETGYYYYRARYYAPEWGRFLQADPLGYGDGMNMYAYVGNDPINYNDPFGTYATSGGYSTVQGSVDTSSFSEIYNLNTNYSIIPDTTTSIGLSATVPGFVIDFFSSMEDSPSLGLGIGIVRNDRTAAIGIYFSRIAEDGYEVPKYILPGNPRIPTGGALVDFSRNSGGFNEFSGNSSTYFGGLGGKLGVNTDGLGLNFSFGPYVGVGVGKQTTSVFDVSNWRYWASGCNAFIC